MEIPWNRYALIVRLAQEMPEGHTMGRTALMKFAYFLQTVKQVPLGYHFSLYTYGPFDSDVLADLSQVTDLNGVNSQTVYYPGGYGYAIRTGDKAQYFEEKASDFLAQHGATLTTIVNEFGTYTPAQLELASTLVFADREEKGRLSDKDLVSRVRQIKPRFSEDQIEAERQVLKDRGYLLS